jgi:NAD(P)-dependent dehydrogenase (short-subunit alcohol dehydrogenase family)
MSSEDEIAAAIVFLCSERASNVAGAAWPLDGGSVPTMF